MSARSEPSSVLGLIADDPSPWATRHGAHTVVFGAPRGERMTPKRWLEATAAIDGRSARDAAALVDAISRRAGLSALGNTPVASLSPAARAALAIAEVAVTVAGERADVVVPVPPFPWPQRHEIRRLAVALLRDARVVLHAREAWELASLVAPDDLVDERDAHLGPREDRRTLVARTYGHGEPYEKFRALLGEAGVEIEGGPIAHLLSVPAGFGVREVIAAAADAALDLLEVRDA